MKKINENKHVLITGITGQVGSQLADYLYEHTNFEIYGLMRWQECIDNLYHLTDKINKNNRIHLYYGDLNDGSSLFKMIDEIMPDFIFHLAAQSYPKTSFDVVIETLQTNIIGTANLLESIKAFRMKSNYDPVIHICSSSEVYGRADNTKKISEDTEFNASSPYSISKIGTDYLGQFYGEAHKMRTFITRMGTHSGPRRSDVFFESTVAKQVALIEAGLQEPIIKVGNLSSMRTYQDARDAVRAYYLLAIKCQNGEINPGEVFNIAGNEVFELKQVIDIIISFSTVKNITVELDKNRLRPIDANYQMFDNSKIKSFIDWEPQISAKQMFHDLLDHWRSEVANNRIPLNR